MILIFIADLILIFINFIAIKTIKIEKITDFNFQQMILNEKINNLLKSRILILFDLSNKNSVDNKAIKILKNLDHEFINENNLKLFFVDCKINYLTCMQFSIQTVPHFILIEDIYYYKEEELQNIIISEENLKGFIKTGNNTRNNLNWKEIPKKVDYYYIAFKILKVIFKTIKEELNFLTLKKVIEMYEVNFNNYSLINLIFILFLGIFIIVVFSECYFLKRYKQ